MNKSLCKSIAMCAFAVLSINAYAGQGDSNKDMGKTGTNRVSVDSTLQSMAEGEVEDIDIANKYVILKHGPIKNLNMEAMTMAFGVKDLSILSKLKVGDKVKFTAETIGDIATITSLKVQH